ncbi:hypothetical protein SESBI_37658 [Sesbania bispinosa]|nr:hypothetical protein SESBI_37658 [Sesbania bispinosa]
MHRSSSISRAPDEFFVDISATGTLASSTLQMAASSSNGYLPIHRSVFDDTKKELIPLHGKSSGQNAIHLIPLVLIFCGLVLWIFSHY